MTHWYGWIAFAFMIWRAALESASLVVNAWRLEPSPSSPFWIAFWVACAAAVMA